MLEGRAPSPCFVPGDAPIVSIDSALLLLNLHKRERAGTKRHAWQRALPPIEEAHAEILRKLAAIRRHRDNGGQN